jgi:hypothetical protein
MTRTEEATATYSLSRMLPAPHYPDFKPLDLEDREHIHSVLRAHPPIMWRHHYKFRWSLADGTLLVCGETAEAAPFGLPPVGGGDLTPAFRLLLEFLGKLTPAPEIHRVPAAMAQRYAGPLSLEVKENRDHSDYVYRTEALTSLKGRKYHRKRNHLKQFLSNYASRYEPMGDRLVESCLELQEEWCRLRECFGNQALVSEERAIHEILGHYNELGCEGGAIMVDGKVVAFSLGEPLNPDTAVIHVEKANPEFPGSYVAINQEFCRHSWSGFTFINREQDLGEEGLRKAKLSYYPDHLVHKVILRRTN